MCMCLCVREGERERERERGREGERENSYLPVHEYIYNIVILYAIKSPDSTPTVIQKLL